MKRRSEARVGAGQVEVYVDPEERSRQGHGCACSRLRQESPGPPDIFLLFLCSPGTLNYLQLQNHPHLVWCTDAGPQSWSLGRWA